jgi:hypothetical protein
METSRRDATINRGLIETQLKNPENLLADAQRALPRMTSQS